MMKQRRTDGRIGAHCIRCLAHVLVLFASSSLVSAAPGPSEVNPPAKSTSKSVIVLRGGLLIDGRGGPPLKDSQIVVQGGTIRQIGDSSLEIPENAVVIDATGKTILPGLIDMHLHVGRDSRTAQARPTLNLRHGVTSARDPGRAIEDDKAILSSGKPLPRLFLTGKHFDQEPHAHPENALNIQSAEQATSAVDRIVANSGSAIKVYFRLPPDLIAATCRRSDHHNIPVTAHLEIYDALTAIDAGVDGLEHVTSCGTAISSTEDADEFVRMVDADNAARRSWRFRLWAKLNMDSTRVHNLVSLMAEKKIFMTPTLNVFERRHGDKLESEAYHIEGFRKMLQFVLRCHDAGVPIVAGSHGKPPTSEEGWAMQHEMQLLVEAGLTPLEVITAATLQPAKFLRCEDRLGSIEVGKQADLAIYGQNPAANIDHLWSVERVMLSGQFVE